MKTILKWQKETEPKAESVVEVDEANEPETEPENEAQQSQPADQPEQAQESADQADEANQSNQKEGAKANEQGQTGGFISLFQKSKIKKHKISYSNI